MKELEHPPPDEEGGQLQLDPRVVIIQPITVSTTAQMLVRSKAGVNLDIQFVVYLPSPRPKLLDLDGLRKRKPKGKGSVAPVGETSEERAKVSREFRRRELQSLRSEFVSEHRDYRARYSHYWLLIKMDLVKE